MNIPPDERHWNTALISSLYSYLYSTIEFLKNEIHVKNEISSKLVNKCCQDNHHGNRACIEKIKKVTDNVIINQVNNESNMNSPMI